MKTIKNKMLLIVLTLAICLCIIPLNTFAAAKTFDACDCQSQYKAGKYVFNTKTKDEFVSKTKLADQYGNYTRLTKAYYYQPGAQCLVANGQSYTIDYSISGSFVPLSTISSKLGVNIKKSTIKITGTASPKATKSKPYIAPYTRKAYHVWSVETCRKTYCSHNKLLATTYKTGTVKQGFKDSKWILFGFSNTSNGLPTSVSSSSNAIFKQ